MTSSKIAAIRSKIPRTEVLAIIAEEAAELAHAALKYRRTIDGTNPTPVSQADALSNLIEELADVRTAVMVLFEMPQVAEIAIDQNVGLKVDRWMQRLEAMEAMDDESSHL